MIISYELEAHELHEAVQQFIRNQGHSVTVDAVEQYAGGFLRRLLSAVLNRLHISTHAFAEVSSVLQS